MKRWGGQNGFTIVELLIVIVVIAVLAAIVVVAYSGIQSRAQQTKIQSDLAQLEKAINVARIQSGKTLWGITGGPGVTADACGSLASGTNMATLAQTDNCWVKYNDTLDKISTAGGVNIRNMKDPWGRPYWIYENEGRATPTDCTKDTIATFLNPHVQWSAENIRNVSNSLSGC